jgi:hypothetical protein
VKTRRPLVSLVLGATLIVPLAAPGGAQDTCSTSDVTVVTSPSGGVTIGNDIFINEVTITPVEGGEARMLDACQGAVFVQSWLGAAFFPGESGVEGPPAGAVIYRTDVAGTWGPTEGSVTAYYAQDGDVPYIGFPGLAPWTDPADAPALDTAAWFIPHSRVVDTFNGEGELQATTGIETQGSTTTVPGEEAVGDDDADDSSNGWRIPAVVGVGVVLVAAALVLRRRRGSPEPE